MKPKAEWAIDSEAMRARGIIVDYSFYFFLCTIVRVRFIVKDVLLSLFYVSCA